MPLNTAADAALNALPGDKAEGYVFAKKDGRNWGNVRRAFENAVRAAKLEDVVFHTLRHTAASHLVQRGATLSEVKDILGHADIKTTVRYAHLSPAHRRAAAERLAGLTPVDSVVDSLGTGFSTSSAHGVKSEPLSPVSSRKAGVAQWQSS